MKKKVFLSIFFLSFAILITGCGNNTKNNSKNESSDNKAKSEIKTTLSCHNEGYLFHSKKYVEHIMYLDKDNKLVQYEHIEKYFDFDDDNNFNMICEGSVEEEVNNNKIYPYLKEVANCDRDAKEVIISDMYYVSKLDSKSKLPSDELEESLDDNYVFDIDSYKAAIGKKGYTCEEK